MDVLFEIIYSLLLMFLMVGFGVSVMMIGLIEGIVEVMLLVVKVFFGILSDYLCNCKWFVVVGYVFGVFSKLLFVIVLMIGVVVIVCIVDCVGKGICGVLCDVFVVDVMFVYLCGVVYGLC